MKRKLIKLAIFETVVNGKASRIEYKSRPVTDGRTQENTKFGKYWSMEFNSVLNPSDGSFPLHIIVGIFPPIYFFLWFSNQLDEISDG